MTSLPKWALGALAFLGLSIGFAAPAQAYYGQHGGGVSISFGDPYSGVYLSIPIGGHRYHHRRNYGYHPGYYGGGHYPGYAYSGYGYRPYSYYQPRYRYRYQARHYPRHWGYQGYYGRGYYGRTHDGWRGHGPGGGHWRHHGRHRWH